MNEDKVDTRITYDSLSEEMKAQIKLSKSNLPAAIENFVLRTSRVSDIALAIGTHYLNEKGKNIGISAVAARQVKGFSLEELESPTLAATEEVIEMLKIHVNSLEKQYRILHKLHNQI